MRGVDTENFSIPDFKQILCHFEGSEDIENFENIEFSFFFLETSH